MKVLKFDENVLYSLNKDLQIHIAVVNIHQTGFDFGRDSIFEVFKSQSRYHFDFLN